MLSFRCRGHTGPDTLAKHPPVRRLPVDRFAHLVSDVRFRTPAEVTSIPRRGRFRSPKSSGRRGEEWFPATFEIVRAGLPQARGGRQPAAVRTAARVYGRTSGGFKAAAAEIRAFRRRLAHARVQDAGSLADDRRFTHRTVRDAAFARQSRTPVRRLSWCLRPDDDGAAPWLKPKIGTKDAPPSTPSSWFGRPATPGGVGRPPWPQRSTGGTRRIGERFRGCGHALRRSLLRRRRRRRAGWTAARVYGRTSRASRASSAGITGARSTPGPRHGPGCRPTAGRPTVHPPDGPRAAGSATLPSQPGRPATSIPGGTWVIARMFSSLSVNQAAAPPLASRATPFSVVGPWSPMA